MDPPSPPALEIIEPEPIVPDSASLEPSETHAPENAPGRNPRVWARAEYLLWFQKIARVPTLLSTGPNADAIPGALGNPNTRTLFGGTVDYHERHGGRFSGGYFLDDADCLSLEASYLFLGKRPIDRSESSAGNNLVLSRPFFDVVNNRQDASLSAYPGLIAGYVDVHTTTCLEGAEGNFKVNFASSNRWSVAALGGFRYWRLQEDLGVNENTTVDFGAPVFQGNNIKIADFFATDNSFYGGQLGLCGRYQYGRLEFELNTKLALGYGQGITTIRGATFINTTPPTFANAGLLALASNSGRFVRDGFAAIPEIGLNLGLRLTERIQLFAGYNFMYWSNVLRPGDQIDTNLNPNLIPTSNTYGTAGGPARPALTLHESSFWVQGLNVGLEMRY